MAYADAIRTKAATMEGVATLIEGIGSSGYPLSWLYWLPTISVVAPFTFTGLTFFNSYYLQIGKLVFFQLSFSGTAGGTLAGVITASLPVPAVSRNISAAVQITDGGLIKSGNSTIGSSISLIDIRLYNSAVYTAGAVGPTVFGFYEAA